ncbi:lysine N(6)-hydroxylase/L-ornithine N(5)-oxygenase family protein [Alkalicoccus chagannorensis]|uniref:lysine N(6)-hydroxylase/L-ornithine N(5)-oxygenase family protein n=1 Tax=Alkalicoccus chagannorensis TaxID=427072 RepID=UPI0003F55733|nr:SidA/IucD/PvdA family monooxygenase [Alkalicoccus chagannorensis]
MTKQKQIHDVIGVGIGPANLGLAALLHPVEEIDALFFDETPAFQWHPGMLLEGSDLQVPFLADLVTFADPTSPFTFLNYIHKQGRMHAFFFFNRFDIPRREYNDYAKWTADQLPECRFGKKVVGAEDKETYYEVVIEDRETKVEERYYARHLVVGTGTKPNVPEHLQGFPAEDVLHTSQYLFHEDSVLEADDVLIAGSGQSAAEVFLEQLQKQKNGRPKLHWYTRSPGFFQLEAGKLGQEVFSPDYVDYYHALPLEKRLAELPNLTSLRNGVEQSTLHQIYDLLYHRTVGTGEECAVIQPNTEVEAIERKGGRYVVTCRQKQEETVFTREVDNVILGTGYKPDIPGWYQKILDDAVYEDEDKQYPAVERGFALQFKDERRHAVYPLTDLVHSHGAGATNLALSVHRNTVIINQIAGRTVYEDQRDTIFQQFSAAGRGSVLQKGPGSYNDEA